MSFMIFQHNSSVMVVNSQEPTRSLLIAFYHLIENKVERLFNFSSCWWSSGIPGTHKNVPICTTFYNNKASDGENPSPHSSSSLLMMPIVQCCHYTDWVLLT